VTPGTIKDDLFRRDFTINAMAVRLDPYQFGELVDPYGGKRDLDQGLIRVLHSRSFEDDPTRIWRTVRYEQRLGFALEKETDEWLRHSVDMISRVSGDRLRHELEHILKEECPEKALCRAEELGALQKLQANLKGNGRLRERFERARRAYPDCQKNSVVYLALLSWRLSEEQIKSFIERLRFSGEAARALRDIPALKLSLPTLESKGLLDSEICRLLDSHQLGAIKAAAIAADPEIVRQRLDLYLDNLRFIVPSLDGDDLQQMGVAPGKKLGRLLRSLKAARVDGRVTTREEEVELVLQWIARGKG
jgi:tRNA nucleotidyltransferase (CCA-adding enzyme)